MLRDRGTARRYGPGMVTPSPAGELTLGHILASAGLDPADVLVIRHTIGGDGLGPADQTPEGLRLYTRSQSATGTKFPQIPPRYWVCFLASGGRRSRLLVVFENHGEVVEERNDEHRFYDLRTTDALCALLGRLVIEWGRDTINWNKRGTAAAQMPVVQIADPDAVPFPGFDSVLLSHAELQTVVTDPRYATWRTALGSVQGIYLIADTSTGQLYVGKADGSERILGRWTQYAANGHGGNIALRELSAADAKHARHFVFSLLRVFGPSTPMSEVDATESHFKRALLTRSYGMNRN